MTEKAKNITTDIWSYLRQHTKARIGMGRCGGSLPTEAWLDFKLAHAQARDAVHAPFDSEMLIKLLDSQLGLVVVDVTSAATSKAEYLRRPDLGRQLSATSRQKLESIARNIEPTDINIIVSDGLSARAMIQVLPLLEELVPSLKKSGLSLSPMIICSFGRVMIQDEIGAILKSKLSLILIGERPGLGTADSLGAYLVYAPVPGKTDADRNCVSNIRQEGLTPVLAARKLHFLISKSLSIQLSGVQLKDGDTNLIL